MRKRLVVCCDGTWNKPDQLNNGVPAPTNVSKLALAIARQDADGVPQEVFYEPGVGTRRRERLSGGIFGAGLGRNVRDCYRFLVERYNPGDELFFFGFSRGAFTARSTVGFVRNSGILLREHVGRVGAAYALYRDRGDDTHPNSLAAGVFRRMYSHPDCDIHFIGVWDTVGALGIPNGLFRPKFVRDRYSFHDTTLSSHVLAAYHALAIDEKRRAFEPTLWAKQADAPADRVLEQVWFAGVHCDVGGGYAEPALSEIPLLWLVAQAETHGLALDHERLVEVALDTDIAPADRSVGRRVSPDCCGPIHESYKSVYKLFKPYERPLAADAQKLAESAKRRRELEHDYDPPQLKTYAGATQDVPDGRVRASA